ncbi:hypothetical protein FQN50_000856 [Emmonsiellopsis sp. PD_5]|nr:hypothetical protein FQN50_000856 [Emmonsiellopsis sp. PD_5]
MEVVRLQDNILNRDIRPDNFIVSPSPEGREGQSYRVLMIDFGGTRVRGYNE